MSPEGARFRPQAYQRGEDTRRRILETARDVFAAAGYEGASTRLLAERAGVNLPAIQYYFGSKEGLYRAVIDDIVAQIEAGMAPVAARIDAALRDESLPHRALLALLTDLLDAFVQLVAGGEHRESDRLLFARAEVDNDAAFDRLQESANRLVTAPCAALIARLLGAEAGAEAVTLRTVAILGQVVIFCRSGGLRALGWSDFDESRVRAVQGLIREHTEAIFAARRRSA